MKHRNTALSAILGLGIAAALGTAAPVQAATTTVAPVPHTAAQGAQHYASAKQEAGNKAFFEAVVKSVAKKQAAHPGLKSVTITYDASAAPSYQSQIAASAQIWNAAETNVKLQAGSSGADFSYREGDDPQGSYASTDGHGSGFVFLDHAQTQEYDSVRVTAHETGHVLGLPDDYSGPCSELMSGGGPGPSCTNQQPDAQERAQVDALWANGFAKALAKANVARRS
ncbi:MULTISPECIES: snapalysin [unclassified Streptomyces]|uniref:snapalysin n=1 Tax=unclassified Streptomyces TaxID=2593676 RepID=UPI003250B2AC